MHECVSCEEGAIVSPAEVMANKLCCPNQVQLDRFHSAQIPELTYRFVRRIFVKPLASAVGFVLKDRPTAQMSISDYAERLDACLLFILREPNQVVDSMVRRGGLSERKAIIRWGHGIREMSSAYSRYNHKSLILNFSDLVNKTSNIINDICDFLNLRYDSSMENGYKSTPNYDKDGIDTSTSGKNVKSYNIRERYSEEYELYVEMTSV